MPLHIRRATSSDTSALVAFNQAMALETEKKTLPYEKISRGVEAVFSDDKKGYYVVAEADGVIAGGLMVTYEWSDWRDAWFWWIQSVYILPEYRGQRLYRQMYDFVKAEAQSVGNVCGFRLYVETDNLNAQSVYDAVGMSRSHYVMYEEEV